MTAPHAYTDPKWIAQEARRQALEEAAAMIAIFRGNVAAFPPDDPIRIACEALCDGLTTDLRALAARPAP